MKFLKVPFPCLFIAVVPVNPTVYDIPLCYTCLNFVVCRYLVHMTHTELAQCPVKWLCNSSRLRVQKER